MLLRRYTLEFRIKISDALIVFDIFKENLNGANNISGKHNLHYKTKSQTNKKYNDLFQSKCVNQNSEFF